MNVLIVNRIYIKGNSLKLIRVKLSCWDNKNITIMATENEILRRAIGKLLDDRYGKTEELTREIGELLEEKCGKAEDLKTVLKKDIGEILDERCGQDHIPYFYFQVEVKGESLDCKELFSISLEELFPGDDFPYSKVVANFGDVTTEKIGKKTYFVKYDDKDSKSPRQVEQDLDVYRLRIREIFISRGKKDDSDKSVDVDVLMSRCCNYHSGGHN